MTSPTLSDKDVLSRYGQPVACLRHAYSTTPGRLGLVCGAGISQGFGLPDWQSLLKQIALDRRVRGSQVDQIQATPTARAEMLFRHFEANQRALKKNRGKGNSLDKEIKGEWFGIIRRILYAHLPNRDNLDTSHPYLGEYLDIILKSPLTVNYNFDSCLEMMLAARQKRNKEPQRGYQSVFDACLPFRTSAGIIYHLNGFLPDNVLEGISDGLVFSEEEFGEQLFGSMTGRYSSMAHHLSQNTFLFLGVSFADENLRHLMRRSAVNNPGHFHYCVHWLDDSKPRNPAYEAALFSYRFDLYNLVTLFLTDANIEALGRLITMKFPDYRDLTDDLGVRRTWIYYITGIPGIGKTSVCRYMGDLHTIDEWLEEPNALLGKPFHQLTPAEQGDVDTWIAIQFTKKNKLLHEVREGVVLVDRAPLDPLSFNTHADLSNKAKWYKHEAFIGKDPKSFRPGMLILLQGNTHAVSARLAQKQVSGRDPKYLQGLQDMLHFLYDCSELYGPVDTASMNLADQIKEVARIIYREPYAEVDIQAQLTKL